MPDFPYCYCFYAGMRVHCRVLALQNAVESGALFLTFARVQQQVLPYLQIHPVDFGKKAACRQTIVLRIVFDLPELFDLVLKVPEAGFRCLKFLIVLNLH